MINVPQMLALLAILPFEMLLELLSSVKIRKSNNKCDIEVGWSKY